MKFLGNNSKFSFFLILFIISYSLVHSHSVSKDKQYSTSGDLKTDFTWLEIDAQSNVNLNIGFALEKNSIIIEPYVIKLIYTPLQKYHHIKMSDIIIFNNFEILFDMNIITKNIFGLTDNKRFIKVQNVLDKLKNRYGRNSENCRFIFSNSIENMTNMDISSTSVNTLAQVNDMNPYLSLVLNVFCFSNMEDAINFHSSIMNMFNDFIGSVASKHLFYFNKNKMNNMKVIFRNMKMNTQTNTAETAGVNSEYGLNQANANNNISNLNIQYAYMIFSNDAVLFTDSPGSKMQNVLYSFSYDSIRDCIIEQTPKSFVLPKEMSESNKCCIKMRIDVKDVFDNIFNICSYKTSLYQCNLESKFIQENLTNKCNKRLVFNIDKAFEDNYNISEYIMSFSSFSKNYIFQKIYEFILSKLKLSKMLPSEKKMLIDLKLTKMIQNLGVEFQEFIKENSAPDLAALIPPIVTTAPLPSLDPSRPVLIPDPIPGTQILYPAKPSLITNNPILKSNIFKLCESHPKMRDCICAAFPLSHICEKNYCLNHPNYYECAPNYCLAKPEDTEACKCKFTPYDTECKCRLNPMRKECFCIKYPASAYCMPDFCLNSNNSNEIYCLCKKNPFAQECKPSYCSENKFDSRCKCLVNPEDHSCKCRINPKNCQVGPDGNIMEYEAQGEILLDENLNHKTKPVNSQNHITNDKSINSSNSNDSSEEIDNLPPNTNETCDDEDIFCLCKNHPNYKECVCLAYPGAEICLPSFCNNPKNKKKYECNPNKNCQFDDGDEINSNNCSCKKDLSSIDCQCKLTPFTKDCFCSKFSSSQLCNMKKCENNNSDSLFCKCEDGDFAPQCESNYCVKNHKSPECFCLVNPSKGYCKCLNDPASCSKSEVNTAIQKFKKKAKYIPYRKEEEQRSVIKNTKTGYEEIDSPKKYFPKQNNHQIEKNLIKVDNRDKSATPEHKVYDMPKSNKKNYNNLKSKNDVKKGEDEYKYIMELYNKQLLFNKQMKKVEDKLEDKINQKNNDSKKTKETKSNRNINHKE